MHFLRQVRTADFDGERGAHFALIQRAKSGISLPMPTIEDVYCKFGMTAEVAQLFETELGTILLARKGEKLGWHFKANPEQAGDLYSKPTRKTLGQVLESIRGLLDLDEQVPETFELALGARNRLNHGFFERHNFAMYSEQGRASMVEELEAINVQLIEAYNVAQPAAVQLVARVRAARKSSASSLEA